MARWPVTGLLPIHSPAIVSVISLSLPIRKTSGISGNNLIITTHENYNFFSAAY
jgi:hypothetical protein